MKNIILIVTKHPESKGGVVNYYRHLFKIFKDEGLELQWFVIGSRPKNYENRSERPLSYSIEFISDVMRFAKLLFLNRRIKIVQLSPSFIPIPVLRDLVFLFISIICRKKTIVFFRGWSTKFQSTILTKKSLLIRVCFKLYRKADHIIVLAEKFKQFLSTLSFLDSKISVSRTMFLHDDIDISKTIRGEILKFIFIGRISYQKGIIEIIEAINILNKKGILVNMNIFGHYADKNVEKDVDRLISDNNLVRLIHINGYLDGKQKYEKLNQSDVFLFPSYHDEGCPNSVIEALASGLFIISTGVGALDEIIKNGENGIIIPYKNAQRLADNIEWAINNRQKVRKIGEMNKKYAFTNFEEKIIFEQLLKIYKTQFKY